MTVQFYKATSNGVVSAEDLEQIAADRPRLRRRATTSAAWWSTARSGRPTEHDGPKVEPPGWWDGFLSHLEADYGWGIGDVFGMWERLRP